MLDFTPFKQAVAAQFDRMSKHGKLLKTEASKDVLWTTYLESFPEGTNPLFKERTEHDCNCCKSFIRSVGNVVAFVDGKLESIWDIQVEGPYQVVANAMAELVKSQAIQNVFLSTERTAGTDKNFQDLLVKAVTWQHFFLNLPANTIVSSANIGPQLSSERATHDVMFRSLTELSDDAIETVLELIAQNSLYRGEEHKFAVESFRKLKREFNTLPEQERDLFVWSQTKSVPESVSRIRNTAIGTLLVDLSNGVEMEDAVKSFEAKVAPTNYKRPTSLITPRMVEQAKAKVEELGLVSALERRYARMTDISVNNILHANRQAKANMTGNVFDDLTASLPQKPKSLDKVEEIAIEKFLTDILPKAESIEVLLENRHESNLVSLIAPADPTAGRLFKWGNNFSWAYNGELADSIKERVKKAGGSVTGNLCCRLGWYNYDDLDLSMVEPNGNVIYYGDKRSYATGGQLDIDMNAGGDRSREAVENIFYTDRRKMKEGVYKLVVHNFNQRETNDVGFEVEIDYLGTVHRFAYDKAVKNKERITVAEFWYSHTEGIKFVRSLPSTQATKTVWGLPTQTFHKVNVAMLSPNHWDGAGVGNKHYFFMLEGCLREGSARGFFNEFLKNELDVHRKTFEVIGSKMQAPESIEQLSGLGFSSTQRNEVTVRLKGAFTRVLKILI